VVAVDKKQGGLIMGLPNRDEVEGKFDQAKGGIKENVGKAINDRELTDEGRADRASGDVQEGWGKTKRKVGEAVEDIGDAIKR
jgi:uncharacterized protein YjbJ (UPF0337 family)